MRIREISFLFIVGCLVLSLASSGNKMDEDSESIRIRRLQTLREYAVALSEWTKFTFDQFGMRNWFSSDSNEATNAATLLQKQFQDGNMHWINAQELKKQQYQDEDELANLLQNKKMEVRKEKKTNVVVNEMVEEEWKPNDIKIIQNLQSLVKAREAGNFVLNVRNENNEMYRAGRQMSKRQTTPTQPTNATYPTFEECSDYGRTVYNYTNANVCNATKLCWAWEAKCSDATLQNYEFWNYTGGNIAQSCDITKMVCLDDDNYLALWDLYAQIGVTHCRISSTFIDYVLSDYINITNIDLPNAAIEVVCDDNIMLGWDVFGMKCQTETLKCANNSNNCTVNVIPCNHLQTHSDGLCSDIDWNCRNQTTFNISNNLIVLQYEQVPCGIRSGTVNTSDWDSFCKPNLLNCFFNNSNVSNVNSSSIFNNGSTSFNLSLCSIQSLTCLSGKNSTTTYVPSDNCTIFEIYCGGTRTPINSTFLNSKLSNCIVTKMACYNGSQIYVQPTSIKELVCNSSYACVGRFFQHSCRNNQTCYRMINDSSCICPIDRNGKSCEEDTKINCTATLTYPRADCSRPEYQNTKDPKDSLLDGDRACYVFDSLQETVNLQYSLSCRFYKNDSFNTTNQFSYWLDASPRFVLSKEQIWSLRLKIFNFNRLSDYGATFWLNLTKDQMMGHSAFKIDFVLGNIDDRYWHGNRLYAELAWENINHAAATGITTTNLTLEGNQTRKNPAAAQNVLHRIFLDSPKYVKQGTYSAATDNTWLIVGLIAAGIVVLICIYFAYKIFKKRQTKKEREEMEKQMSNEVFHK